MYVNISLPILDILSRYQLCCYQLVWNEMCFEQKNNIPRVKDRHFHKWLWSQGRPLPAWPLLPPYGQPDQNTCYLPLPNIKLWNYCFTIIFHWLATCVCGGKGDLQVRTHLTHFIKWNNRFLEHIRVSGTHIQNQAKPCYRDDIAKEPYIVRQYACIVIGLQMPFK